MEGNGSFLIPVEVTPSSATGVAVSNVSVLSFNVRLRLFREDGSLVGSASDSRFSRLPTHGQVADFVTSFFPQLVNTTFRGTLVVDAPASAPPNPLAATALAGKRKSTVRASGRAWGFDREYYAHLSSSGFGDGYSTTITVINAGLVAVTSQLRFFSQNGALRSEFLTPVNLAVGGSVRYTIPNTGPLTVIWGELVTTAGTVEGVATFELRAANGTLITAAGVLGIQPGNAFSLPVDVAANGQTGIAIANVKDTNVNVGYRLIGETASQIAIASDLRFLSLPSRGQVADFIRTVFPIIAGTNFKGALIIEAGPAAAPGSLAATALTVKEGVLAALPVIPGTLASNTGGGGGGTGGGGTGGGGTGGGGSGGGGTGGGGTTGNNGPASACINPAIYNSVFTTHLEYNIVSGSITGTSVSDTTSKLNVAFEAVTATEFSFTNSTTIPVAGTTTVTGKSYGSIDGLDVIGYGGTSDITMPLPGTTKAVFTPPSRDKRYSLAAGASATQTYTITSTATFTGLPPINSSQSQTETVRYLGRDSVTVPAARSTPASSNRLSVPEPVPLPPHSGRQPVVLRASR